MQLPLNVCQQFGQFAYQDKQKGVEAIAAIQGFMKEDQDGNESQAKTVTIERDQAGVITVAKSVKLLPNMQINLKALIQDGDGQQLAPHHNWVPVQFPGPVRCRPRYRFRR